ncbi:MAG: hypothetical protein QXP36_04615, partial [Conexivisphaerales archaeon]
MDEEILEVELENLVASSEEEINSVIEALNTIKAEINTTNEVQRKRLYYMIGYAIEKNKEIFEKVFPNENIYKKVALAIGKSASTVYRCHQYFKKYPTNEEFKSSLIFTWREICKTLPEAPVDNVDPDTVIFKCKMQDLQQVFSYFRNHKYFLAVLYVTDSVPNVFYVVGSKEFSQVVPNSSVVLSS